MEKLFTRVVALFLAFCLAADPALASLNPQLPFQPVSPIPYASAFTQQALVEPSWLARPVRWIREAGRLIRDQRQKRLRVRWAQPVEGFGFGIPMLERETPIRPIFQTSETDGKGTSKEPPRSWEEGSKKSRKEFEAWVRTPGVSRTLIAAELIRAFELYGASRSLEAYDDLIPPLVGLGWDPDLMPAWKVLLRIGVTGKHYYTLKAIKALATLGDVPADTLSELIMESADVVRSTPEALGSKNQAFLGLATCLARHDDPEKLIRAWSLLLSFSRSYLSPKTVEALDQIDGVPRGALAEAAHILLTQTPVSPTSVDVALGVLIHHGATEEMKKVWNDLFGQRTQGDASTVLAALSTIEHVPSDTHKLIDALERVRGLSGAFLFALSHRLQRENALQSRQIALTRLLVGQGWREDLKPAWEDVFRGQSPVIAREMLEHLIALDGDRDFIAGQVVRAFNRYVEDTNGETHRKLIGQIESLGWDAALAPAWKVLIGIGVRGPDAGAVVLGIERLSRLPGVPVGFIRDGISQLALEVESEWQDNQNKVFLAMAAALNRQVNQEDLKPAWEALIKSGSFYMYSTTLDQLDQMENVPLELLTHAVGDLLRQRESGNLGGGFIALVEQAALRFLVHRGVTGSMRSVWDALYGADTYGDAPRVVGALKAHGSVPSDTVGFIHALEPVAGLSGPFLKTLSRRLLRWFPPNGFERIALARLLARQGWREDLKPAWEVVLTADDASIAAEALDVLRSANGVPHDFVLEQLARVAKQRGSSVKFNFIVPRLAQLGWSDAVAPAWLALFGGHAQDFGDHVLQALETFRDLPGVPAPFLRQAVTLIAPYIGGHWLWDGRLNEKEAAFLTLAETLNRHKEPTAMKPAWKTLLRSSERYLSPLMLDRLGQMEGIPVETLAEAAFGLVQRDSREDLNRSQKIRQAVADVWAHHEGIRDIRTLAHALAGIKADSHATAVLAPLPVNGALFSTADQWIEVAVSVPEIPAAVLAAFMRHVQVWDFVWNRHTEMTPQAIARDFTDVPWREDSGPDWSVILERAETADVFQSFLKSPGIPAHFIAAEIIRLASRRGEKKHSKLREEVAQLFSQREWNDEWRPAWQALLGLTTGFMVNRSTLPTLSTALGVPAVFLSECIRKILTDDAVVWSDNLQSRSDVLRTMIQILSPHPLALETAWAAILNQYQYHGLASEIAGLNALLAAPLAPAWVKDAFLDLILRRASADLRSMNVPAQVSVADGLNTLAEVVLTHPGVLNPDQKASLADIIVQLGPSVGSHLESLIYACVRSGILSNIEANRVMIYSTFAINPNSGLPQGSLGWIQYYVLGYVAAGTHPLIESSVPLPHPLNLLWSNPRSPDGKDPVPPAGAHGFRGLTLRDAHGTEREIIGYLGTLAPLAVREEVIDRPTPREDLIAFRRSDSHQIYKLGGVYYSRPLKMIRRFDGTIVHRAFLGYSENLALAYYQFIESGAIFTACVNASALKETIREARAAVQKAGGPIEDHMTLRDKARQTMNTWREVREVLEHPERIPGFDIQRHQGDLLMDEQEAWEMLSLFRSALVHVRDHGAYRPYYKEFIAPRLSRGDRFENQSWEDLAPLIPAIPRLYDWAMAQQQPQDAYDLYRLFPLSQLSELYFLPALQSSMNEEGLRIVARYIGEKWKLPSLTQASQAHPLEIVHQLGKLLGHYPHWAGVLGGMSTLVSYNEVDWLETNGVSGMLGNAADPVTDRINVDVSHYPVSLVLAGLIGRPSDVSPQTPPTPLVFVDLPKDLSLSLGLQGRRKILAQGMTVRDILHSLGISPRAVSFRVALSIHEAHLDQPVMMGETLELSPREETPQIAPAFVPVMAWVLSSWTSWWVVGLSGVLLALWRFKNDPALSRQRRMLQAA